MTETQYPIVEHCDRCSTGILGVVRLDLNGDPIPPEKAIVRSSPAGYEHPFRPGERAICDGCYE